MHEQHIVKALTIAMTTNEDGLVLDVARDDSHGVPDGKTWAHRLVEVYHPHASLKAVGLFQGYWPDHRDPHPIEAGMRRGSL